MESEKLEDVAKSVVISVNPRSGASDSRAVVDQLNALLQADGMETFVLSDIEQVKAKAEQLLADHRLRAVVAAGGDGTVSLLANLLPPSTPIAILPLGTENLLAKFLEIAPDPQRVADMISQGETQRLDVGRANGKLFLVMASCGFDAEVVARLHAKREGHIQHWSYARPILSAIRRYKYPTIRFNIDDGRENWTGRWGFVFNVPRYAMGLPIVPDANAQDGKLDLCTFRGGSLLQGLGYLGAVLLRRHRSWTNARFARFETLRIESDQSVPYQLDGDPGGTLPLEISVDRGKLRVLVPASWEANSAG